VTNGRDERRALTLHPHYENKEIRMRYRSVYQMYNRLPEVAVYASLQPLHVNYLVIDFTQCDGQCFPGFTHDTIAAAGLSDARALVERSQRYISFHATLFIESFILTTLNMILVK
jgi:hypothetical protein